MGFYKNIGNNVYDNICKVVERGFQESLDHSHKQLEVSVPEGQCSLRNDILSIWSATYPDIRYEFDLKEPLHELYTYFIEWTNDKIHPNIEDIDWDFISTGPRNIYGISPAIDTSITRVKDDIVVILRGWNDSAGFYVGINGRHNPKTNTYENYFDFAFKGKYRFEQHVKESPVRVCLDLRNYISKTINDLGKGRLTPIQVKTNIETYLKRLV